MSRARESSPDAETLSTWQAAQKTGLSDQTIREYIKSGKLRATRAVDGRFLLDARQVEQVAYALRLLREAQSA